MNTCHPAKHTSMKLPSFAILFSALMLAGIFLSLGTKHALAGWQGPFPLSSDFNETSSVAVGDLDADGNLDIVIGSKTTTSKIYFNKGDGSFLPGMPLTHKGIAVTSVALADIDNNGTLDIVVARQDNPPLIFTNPGSGKSFAETSLTDRYSDLSKVAVADVNGDGLLDIVAGGKQGIIIYCKEKISDSFHACRNLPISFSSPYTITSIALADVVSNTISTNLPDIAPDIIVGIDGQPSLIFKNDGVKSFLLSESAVFTNTSFISLGSTKSTTDIYTGTQTVSVGDVNADGKLDIILSGRSQVVRAINPFIWNKDSCSNPSDIQGQVYLNKIGVSQLFDAPDLNFSIYDKNNQIASSALGDINNDGTLDLLTGRNDNDRASDLFFLNLVNFPLGVTEAKILLCQKAYLSDTDYSDATGVAMGDLNGDGFLDVVIGNKGKQDVIYLHDGKFRFSPESGSGSFDMGSTVVPGLDNKSVRDLAVGDMDKDGYLDVITVGENNKSAVYKNITNNGLISLTSGIKLPLPTSDTFSSLAVGDLDDNGFLDVLVGGSSLIPILNIPTVPSASLDATQFQAMLSSPITTVTGSNTVALGDINNDGYLDVIAGGRYSTMTVVLNDGSGTFNPLIDLSFAISNTVNNIALGDLNGDGSLDIVAGQLTSTVYLNDGVGRFHAQYQLTGTNVLSITKLALGDLNADSYLDIVAVVPGHKNLVYFNNGSGEFSEPTVLQSTANVTSIALGDLNGDGALDIVAGNNGTTTLQDSLVYFNNGKGKFSSGEALDYLTCDFALGLALGDLNNDGSLEVIQGTQPLLSNPCKSVKEVINTPRNAHIEIFQAANQAIHTVNNLPNNPYRLSITRPTTTGNANFYSTPQRLEDGTIPITYTLYDRESDPVTRIELLYSLDGGGNWITSTLSNVDVASKTNLSTGAFPANGVTRSFDWDVFGDGFTGQSDNVVLQLRAYSYVTTPLTIPILYTYSVAMNQQLPYVSATTFPFRVRGTRVRVFEDTIAETQVVSQAIVYRMPAGSITGTVASLLEKNHKPFVTDIQGFLQGRERLLTDEELIALYPVTATTTYTLYHTSQIYLPDNLSDVQPYTIKNLGVQNITVSASLPLILFNLDISLEWNAGGDTQYMYDLEKDLQEVSKTIYDWTNGQAALGNVTIYHAKQHWEEADVRIYATNRLRPYAKVGGVTRGIRGAQVKNGATTKTLLFSRGQVHMGALWNKYGQAGTTSHIDWINTLAHELGHHFFYLLDNYVGLSATGVITSVENCLGVMSNPYDERRSEFHPETNWSSECNLTLAQAYYGHSDWEIIKQFYPELNSPISPTQDIDYAALQGPLSLKLQVTQIHQVTVTFTNTLATDMSTLKIIQPDESTYEPSSQARVFLFKNGSSAGTRLIDLGTPRRDQVRTWNIEEGDTLCVYDLAQRPEPQNAPLAPPGDKKIYLPFVITPDDGVQSTGFRAMNACRTITKSDTATEVSLLSLDRWQPEVIITPTREVNEIVVRNLPPGLSLLARHFPVDDVNGTSTTAPIPLTYDSNLKTYSGVVRATRFTPDAYIQVWNSNVMTQGVMIEYSIGGAPTLSLSDGDTLSLIKGNVIVTETNRFPIHGTATLRISRGSILTLARDGLTLSLSDGSTLSLSDGNIIPLDNGATLSLSDGNTLSLSDGSTLSLSDGSVITIKDGATNIQTPVVINDGNTLVMNSGEAPIRSSDGRMTLFITNTLAFSSTENFTVQQTALVPRSPSFATAVGQAYRVTMSPGAIALLSGSVRISYFGSEVAMGKEKDLLIYHWNGIKWEKLTTSVDEDHNTATAPSAGVGIYGLMYSEKIHLLPGWNNFVYRVEYPSPLPEILQSIEGQYTIIWEYDPTPSDGKHWHFYQPPKDGLPEDDCRQSNINTLCELRNNLSYWIYIPDYVTNSVDLLINASPTIVMASSDNEQANSTPLMNSIKQPPALLQGAITISDSTEVPLTMLVTVWINDTLCGQSTVQQNGDKTDFLMQVAADSDVSGCGEMGKTIEFRINGQPTNTTVMWDNSNLLDVVLHAPTEYHFDNQLFIPLVQR